MKHKLITLPFYSALLFCIALISSSPTGSTVLSDTSNWPTISLPKNIQIIQVGEHITLNGLPIHAQAFVSSEKPSTIIASFKNTLGQPLVESSLGTKYILGRAQGAQGEYYLTVQIEAAASGSRGVIAMTHPQAAYSHQTETQADYSYWLSRFPAESRLTSQTSSQDQGTLSKHFIVTNHHSIALNQTHLKKLLLAEGFELQHETSTATSTQVTPENTLYFKGKGKEAIATITHDAQGQTAVVLNLIHQLEAFK